MLVVTVSVVVAGLTTYETYSVATVSILTVEIRFVGAVAEWSLPC